MFSAVSSGGSTSEPLHEWNSPEAIFETTTLVVIMVASFFANILAMTQILTSQKTKHHHSLLIANLNIIDLGVVLFSMSFSVVAVIDGGTLLSTNATVCTINGFFATTCTIGNFINVMCIAVDRYLSIVWPARFPPTRRRMYLTIIFVWLACISIGLPPAVGVLTTYEYNERTHHCSPKWGVESCVYYTIWATVIFVITVPVMIICYVCIIYHILKSDRKLRSFDATRRATVVNDESKKLSASHAHGKYRVNVNQRPNCYECSFPSTPIELTKGDNYRGKPDDLPITAVENAGFQGDEPTHHVNMKDEPLVNTMTSGSYTISGQIDEHTGVIQQLSDSNQPKNCPSSDSGENKSSSNKLSGKKRRLSREKRVALVGAMLVLTTILCWTPYSVTHFCAFEISVSHPFAVMTMWVAYLNSLLDPLIYVFMNRKERTIQHVSRILTAFCHFPVDTWRRLCGKESTD
ncbi:D(2) dopamine receptor B-like [Lytechinus variegatus]|uniref:D(2) dopamine receptor B-like n=1 Tax=Lytechinus variegatus TaxID=7654 RepID=UPI001BB25420|nr:D(2) dopamine receptor B-like [Lytechinus variegatus]